MTSGSGTSAFIVDGTALLGAGGGGGAVSSVFGRTGVVVAQSGDYSIAQISGAGTAAAENLSAIIIDNGAGALTIGPSQVTAAMLATGVGTPGGNQYDVQLNDGAGGFAGSDNLNFQGGYLTINGDSGYGQLQWLNSPITGGYAGSGISGIDNEIITGALAGDMTFWSSQAMNFSADTGNTNMLRINTNNTIYISGNIVDLNNINSITPNSRTLSDSLTSTVSVDWGGRMLFDTGAIESVDWSQRELINSSSQAVMNWGAQTLLTTSGGTSVDWGGFRLSDGALTSIDWSVRQLTGSSGGTMLDYSSSGSGTAVLNLTTTSVIFTQDIYDTSSRVSIDTNSRILWALGNIVLVDWTSNTTNTGSAKYWFDSNNNDRITGDGSGLTGIAGVTIGSSVVSSSANELLYVDASNNLANAGSFDGTNMNISGNITAASLTGDGSSITNIAASNIASGGSFAAIDGSALTGISLAQILATSGITAIADGTYAISATLGGSVTFQGGIVTAWTPAS